MAKVSAREEVSGIGREARASLARKERPLPMFF
jgi:hypothetical protein